MPSEGKSRGVEVLLLILLVAAVGVAIWWYRNRRAPKADQPRRDPLAQRGGVEDELRRLRPGAIITYEGRDHVVRGSLHFDQGGYTWDEHLLDDLAVRRWLSVEDDEGLEVALWRAIPLADVASGTAGDTEVTADGTTYRLSERGQARFSAEGTTGTSASGSAEYVDYDGGDGRLLSFERYGTTAGWEVGLGAVVQPGELTVYPAPQE